MDRIAFLSSSEASAAGSRKKRRHGASQETAQQQQQRLIAKAAAAMGKVQRTDTEHNPDEQPATDAGTQDSVQTAYQQSQHLQQQQQQLYRQQYSHPAMAQQQQQQQYQQQQCSQHSQQQQLEAQEDIDGSGSEVEGPVADDKYIKGTRLIINGWFQACRGCNEPTAHTTLIARRDVPLCPRCQGKYLNMINGCYPPSLVMPDPCIEPLHYWLPRVLGPVPPLSAAQRRDFCDSLVLRQDDAWLQLIQIS